MIRAKVQKDPVQDFSLFLLLCLTSFRKVLCRTVINYSVSENLTRQIYNLFQDLWNGFIIQEGGEGVQSLFDAMAVQTVTLLAMLKNVEH